MTEKYKYFIIEGAELVDMLTRDLLELEKRREDADLIDRIFRHAHKLKGAAGVVQLTEISGMAHDMENCLARVKESKKSVSSREITELLGLTTELEKLLDTLKDGGTETSIQAPPIETLSKPQTPETIRGEKEQSREVMPETIRIPASDLDRLNRLTNEIHINNGRLKNISGTLAGIMRKRRRLTHGMANNGKLQQPGIDLDLLLERDIDRLEQEIQSANELSREMTDAIKAMRLIPVESIAYLFEKAVRDFGIETGKKIEFSITGREHFLDRALLDLVKEPIFQLLRNSVIHGIEGADERQSVGKVAEGSIQLIFARDRGSVRIICDDDGRGLDAQMIREKAVEDKMIDAEVAATMTADESLYLVLRSGLSMASSLTQLAGRGVGMDVVRDCVTGLAGTLEIASAKDRFTRFTMTLPLSIDIIPVFAVRIARLCFMIPLQNLVSTRLVTPAEIAYVAGKPVIQFNGAPIPLAPLANLLEIETASAHSEKFRVVIVKANIDTAALVVDELEGRKEIMVQSLQGRLCKIAHLMATTISADGNPAYVLDTPSILEAIKFLPVQTTARENDKPVPTVMVVDDSLTTRRLIEEILGAEGYRILPAGSGEQALGILETEKVDLFVVDIEMPGLDGFELSKRIRGSGEYQTVPIVILSTHGSDADKRKGMVAGANAYIVKSTFDQEAFLATVGSLIS